MRFSHLLRAECPSLSGGCNFLNLKIQLAQNHCLHYNNDDDDADAALLQLDAASNLSFASSSSVQHLASSSGRCFPSWHEEGGTF